MNERVSETKTDIKKESSSTRIKKVNSPQISGSLADRIIFFQRSLGNRVIEGMIRSETFQPKLGILRPIIQRDLARPPRGAPSPLRELTPQEITSAIGSNQSRFNDPFSIRIIRDVIGLTPFPAVVDEEFVRAVCRWQADFGLRVDGDVGLFTLRTIVRELIAERSYNHAINLIIDGHNMPTNGLASIRYDPTVAVNARTSGPIPGNSTVRVGQSGFSQGYEGLVHTIAHELEHVRQRRIGIANQNVREFLGEAVEIMSRGMFMERLAGFMDDANRARHHWNLMPVEDRRTYWTRFVEVRDRVRQRFNAASAAEQNAHQTNMDAYNAIVAPPPP